MKKKSFLGTLLTVVIAAAVANRGVMMKPMLAMRINLRTGKPLLANTTGDLSGPAVFPVAIRMVYQVTQAVDIPVIGMGGVRNTLDVLEMIMAGATAVQIGAANLVDPFICKEIIEALPARMEEYGIESLDEIRGCVGPMKIDVE